MSYDHLTARLIEWVPILLRNTDQSNNNQRPFSLTAYLQSKTFKVSTFNLSFQSPFNFLSISFQSLLSISPFNLSFQLSLIFLISHLLLKAFNPSSPLHPLMPSHRHSFNPSPLHRDTPQIRPHGPLCHWNNTLSSNLAILNSGQMTMDRSRHHSIQCLINTLSILSSFSSHFYPP